ncbi:Transcription-repair-coupling factor [Posidoniimonas polymericola]|uniref:Transcription-repair-coupling factor n=1 Tax=Posidoniimonas polymericola TaxID=2528002 RepID=A0A5C5YUF4_9BACT|nr:transcription-repair coupling factor [Posidoniimonas polymericola]TWT78461.1 Transcription-repair-coupling factor [Posidoniimonas polymericola]
MDTPPAVAADALTELRRLAAKVCARDDFSRVVESLEAGRSGTLGGVWGSARALVAAAVASRCPGPLFVVAPHQADVDRLLTDLALFTDLTAAAFPAWQRDQKERVLHDEVYGQRLRVLKSLARTLGPGGVEPHAADGPPRVIVTSIHGLMQPTPAPEAIAGATRRVEVGDDSGEEELVDWLTSRGCHRTSAVELPGEFAVRGGIIDVFPPDEPQPVRIEYFGDEIESIRRFDVANQRSAGAVDAVDLTLLEPSAADRAHMTLYAPPESWFLLIEPTDLAEEGKFYLERSDDTRSLHSVRTSLAEVYKHPSVTAAGVPAGSLEETSHLGFESVERLSGDIQRVRDELASISEGQTVFIVCPTEAETQRLTELLAETPLYEEDRLRLLVGDLAEGFRVVAERAVVLSSSELFNRHETARGAIRQVAGRAIDTFLELREGDLIVHVTHGIGRYRGIKLLEKEGRKEEHLDLEYHGGTRIYVPSTKIELVQKYVGGKALKVPLARIGGKAWVRQKQAAEKAVTDLAAEMLEMQARRDARPGIALPEDTPWQVEFDAAFPYDETPDQLRSIAEIKADLTRPRPMDRLLCGDVGFGKTELAIRAAFKAVDAGYQVALLAPTTVLAEQHRRTFSERMAEFPFEIACLSRFCTAKEQRQIIERAREGSVDIVIGTHRLASGDVAFANLGLLIIDEEQRFGVAVKERLKALRSAVDVLTMTATPIPRTLHMALLGARSISNLETPPSNRLAVETRVTRFNEEMVRHAMLRELNRGGQAYFVHNRVHDIKAVADKLNEIVPEARIGIGHGQMPEGELEDVMVKFVAHEYDILLATTIIESGLDIPNANTMFVDDADRYGLADLHQLRGRVGRANRRGYCYLLIQEDRQLPTQAARRLRAVEEFSQLGAGFALSMRDLEIRGAGNLLGTQQSGHIATVGYEMYCQMLEKAVRHLRKLPPKESVDVTIDLPVHAYLPGAYVPDMRSKIDLYRRLARASTLAEVEDFAGELADRFGPVPDPASRMLELARLRVCAHQWGVQTVRREDNFLVFAYTERGKVRELVERSGGRLRIADAQSAYLPLNPGRTGVDDLLGEVKTLLRPARDAA